MKKGKYASYITRDSYVSMAVQLIESHHDYCNFIFKQQAPKVEGLLTILSNELEKELSRIS